MDLSNGKTDHLVVATAIAGAGVAVEIAKKAANAYKKIGNLPLLTRIRHKAQLKSGLKKLEQGNISGMSGGEKDRLVEAGIDPALIGKSLANELAGQATPQNTANTPVEGTTTDANINTLKKYLPYILGGVAVVILVIFLIKRK